MVAGLEAGSPRQTRGMTAIAGAPWLPAIRRYLIASAIGNLAWEVAQLPLFTLWNAGTHREIAIAVAHCTAGDVLIATTTLVGALVFTGAASWPEPGFRPVAVITILAGMTYTAWSEYWNTTVTVAWQYADIMPLVPGLGIGVTPILQWLLIPAVALSLARAGRQFATGRG